MAARRSQRTAESGAEPTEQAGGTTRHDNDGKPSRRGGEHDGERLTAARAAHLCLRHITELTGKVAEGVTAVEPADEGWTVGVEVIEDRRIPLSTDVLAIYQVRVSQAGELVSYRRLRRYRRGQGDSDQGGEGW